MNLRHHLLLGICSLVPIAAPAWDYDGHRAINELALAALPTNFPAFVTSAEARTRIGFLAGEADRWRNVTSTKDGTGLCLGHASGPDHYLDMEHLRQLDLTPETLPPLRYDFVAAIVRARAAHPERFEPIDPSKDADHTRELVGFLPWAVAENFQRLQSGFAVLKALETHGGTPEEISNAKQNILYVMGVMGHFAGDASQPLHTTMYHHGWTTNNNPNHYTTSYKFHQWIDGGFFAATGGIDVKKLSAQVVPAEKISPLSPASGVFPAAARFVADQNTLVERLYILDRDGCLSNKADRNAQGRAFLEGQLLKSAKFLGDIWLTAWLTAPQDTFLEKELDRRAQTSAGKTSNLP